MPSLLAATFFFLFLALQVVLYTVVTSAYQTARRRRITTRIQPLPDRDPARSLCEGTSATPIPSTPAIRLLRHLLPLQRLDNLLIAADLTLSMERFLLIAVAAGGVGFCACYAVSRTLLISVGIAWLCASLPFVVLLHRRKKKEAAIVQQLPEALDMIVRALRVGQSVDNALVEVARSCPPPLGPEMRIMHEEVSLGIPFISALRNFGARFARLPDVKLMITAFVIQHETGGNLSQILDNLADLIRKRDTLRRQVRALTAEGRSSSLVLGVLPLVVGLFFWIARPAYIQVLFDHPVGRKLLLLAILLELAGFMTMRLLTRMTP